ncbi:MAG: LysR family transcriptional regulator [Burkholderiaceae bacterium]
MPLSDKAGGLAVEPSTADIAVLVRVAEMGSLSAVARERDVPVSQVSRAVSRLEDAYRVKFLNRSTHGLSVTAEGELFLTHARRVVESLTDLSGALDTRSGSPIGTVRLSVSQIMGDVQVIPSLPALVERYPGLRIDVIADDSMIDLATEGIDLAIRTNVVANENLVATWIGEYGRGLFASPEYIARFGAPQHPDELHRHRCITHAVSGGLNRWRFRIGRKQIERPVAGHHRVNNTAMAMTMARAGLGIARLNTASAHAAIRSGEIVEVLGRFRDPRRFPVYVVMMPDRHRLPKIRVCVEHFAAVFGAASAATSAPRDPVAVGRPRSAGRRTGTREGGGASSV